MNKNTMSAVGAQSRKSGRRKKGPVERFLKTLIQNFFLLLGILCVTFLPRRLERALGHGIGWFLAHRIFYPYHVCMANLKLVYGDAWTEEDRRRFLVRNFKHIGMVVTDYFWFAWNSERRVKKYCEFGDDTMRRWVQGDFPGVFVTAHLGNWELGGQYVAENGRVLYSVFKKIGGRSVSQWLRKFRSQNNQRIIPREGAMRGVLRAVKERALVAMLLDQHTTLADGAEYVDFLGLPVTMSTSVGTLSHRLGVPVLLAAVVYDEKKDRYCLTTLRELTGEDVKRMDAHAITIAIRDSIEEMIRRWPEQWLWAYPRWKRYRTPEEASRYPFYAKEDYYYAKAQAEKSVGTGKPL